MASNLMIGFSIVIAAYYMAEIAGKARSGHDAIDMWYHDGWRRELLHLFFTLALVSVATAVCGHLYLSVAEHAKAAEHESA